MNSAYTLATLTRKRAAVDAWITENELSRDLTDSVFAWHMSYWARLDDAIEYLSVRVERQRGGCPDCGGVDCFPTCPSQL